MKLTHKVLDKLYSHKDFFQSKKFLAIAGIILICSIASAGGLIFLAGNFETTVTISDTPPTTYDCTIDGNTAPVTITENLNMMPDSTQDIEYYIKNNEPITLYAYYESVSSDGLTITVLDGTLSPTNYITVDAGETKYFTIRYTTDAGLTVDDVLTATVNLKLKDSTWS